jgi:two-component system alkaline phosphatase synthesis response regulator PhoP
MAKKSKAKKRRVLVVDDEPDFAALLRSILMKAGYSVAKAYNCEDALLQVRKARPDVITLDIQMPRKSGVFFYRKLKEQEEFRDIPVVVMTGLTCKDKEMESLVRYLLEPEGIPNPDAYLEKPVDRPRFLKTIRDVILSDAR